MATTASAKTLLIGTSRTMADYNPEQIEKTWRKHQWGTSYSPVFNLGNLGNWPSQLLANKQVFDINPTLVVLEFSPHMFLTGAPIKPTRTSRYEQYRQWKKTTESLLLGWITSTTGLDDTLNLWPRTIIGFLNAIKNHSREACAATFYETLRSNGFGQILGPRGQVTYRNYLPDRQAAILLNQRFSGSLEEYRNRFQRKKMSEKELKSYLEIIDKFAQKAQVVIVRPPLDERMYKLENRYGAKLSETLISQLGKRRIPFIDLNPNNFYSSDQSHIDWYDTDHASTVLANGLLESLSKSDVVVTQSR